MKLSYVVLAALVLAPAAAQADGQTDAQTEERSALSVVSGQFADHVEGGKPVGDAASIAAAKKIVYWLDVANTGDPAQVTIVWTVDGKEAQRQSLDVGKSRHWRTWGTRPVGSAKTIAVQVLDAGGNSLKEDTISL